MRDKVEAEVTRLEEAGIIEKVDSATDWISPIVLSPKKDSNEIRICVDMVEPNQAIKRTRHVIPTVEELRYDLNGAKIFSKLDLTNGFHQLELDEVSRSIMTFSTHIGLRRYCRLNFGTNSAPEIFHKELKRKLEGITGVKKIHEDILVYGVDEKDHYRALSEVFSQLRESGLTLKRNKCEFGRTSVKFFGLIFSDQGISPEPEKVKALHWVWTTQHKTAFHATKEKLRTTALLNYYDPNLKTEVICDGSPVGVGTMLVQYGQIEHESLAIQYGCLRNEICLLGRDFDVITDHKPVLTLYNNPRRPGPFRVERMRLKLQGFSFKVVYRTGKLNPADYTSRHPLPLSQCSREELQVSAELEAHVNWVVTNDVPLSLKLKEIRKATHCDPVLHDLCYAVKNKQALNEIKFKQYKNVAEELSVVKGVLLRGDKIVLPTSLQNKVVKIAHEGQSRACEDKTISQIQSVVS